MSMLVFPSFCNLLHYLQSTSHCLPHDFNGIFYVLKNVITHQMSSKNIQCVNGIQKYGPFIRKKPKCLWLLFSSCHSTHLWQSYDCIFSKMTWKVQCHSWHCVHFLIKVLYIVFLWRSYIVLFLIFATKLIIFFHVGMSRS
jgi:hypothetical protein